MSNAASQLIEIEETILLSDAFLDWFYDLYPDCEGAEQHNQQGPSTDA
jgi:hypothetical protein